MRWPWGRNEKDREAALERAEAALREMTAAFYEAEAASRRVDFYLSEIRRLLEEGFGLHRASLAHTLATGDRVDSGYDRAFTEYFEVLDSLTRLSRHSTARKLARAAWPPPAMTALSPAGPWTTRPTTCSTGCPGRSGNAVPAAMEPTLHAFTTGRGSRSGPGTAKTAGAGSSRVAA